MRIIHNKKNEIDKHKSRHVRLFMAQPIKQYVQPNELRTDSFRLAAKVVDSGFRPDFMVCLWRGGAPVGCYVHEFLKYKGVAVDHIAIRTSKYTGINQAETEVKVHNLTYLIENLREDTNLLVVDDIFDSGHSVKAFLDKLYNQLGRNAPNNVKVATVFYKPLRNKTNIYPDYFIHETDKWVVFPHELEGATSEEIAMVMGEEIAKIVEKSKDPASYVGKHLSEFCHDRGLPLTLTGREIRITILNGVSIYTDQLYCGNRYNFGVSLDASKIEEEDKILFQKSTNIANDKDCSLEVILGFQGKFINTKYLKDCVITSFEGCH